MELFLKTCITLETEDCVGVLTCIYSGFHGVCRNRGVLVSERTEKAIDSGAFICVDSRDLPERAAAVASVGRQDAVHCARHSAVLSAGQVYRGSHFWDERIYRH